MSAPSPYLEGFRAAVRPEAVKTAGPAPGEAAPGPSEKAEAPTAPLEDLSPEERRKRRLHPLDSFVRLLEGAAANRPPDLEDQFRFQWFGLFYQAPEQDAFTLRLRLPGGRIKPFQLAGLAEITQRHASGQVLLNAKGGLDVPGVPVTSSAGILEQVEGLGLSARRTGGDCVQAVRGGELDDLPVYPLVCALEQALALGPTFADLPLPCEIVFATEGETFPEADPPSRETVRLQVCTRAHPGSEEGRPPAQDTAFLLHLSDEAKEAFWLSPERVVAACLQLLTGWAAGADRSSRAKAGLAGFLAGLNPDAVSALLGDVPRVARPLRAKHEIPPPRDDSPAGCLVPGGRLLSGQLRALEQGCREQNWRELRLRRGYLHAADADGRMVDAAAILRGALST